MNRNAPDTNVALIGGILLLVILSFFSPVSPLYVCTGIGEGIALAVLVLAVTRHQPTFLAQTALVLAVAAGNLILLRLLVIWEPPASSWPLRQLACGVAVGVGVVIGGRRRKGVETPLADRASAEPRAKEGRT